MDLLFNGIGVDCNREELEASIVCPEMANEKGIKKINDTHFSISLFGEVSNLNMNLNLINYSMMAFTLNFSTIDRKMPQVQGSLRYIVVSRM